MSIMINSKALKLIFALCFLFSNIQLASLQAQEKFNKQSIKMPMADGINLAADLYLPIQKKDFPVIFIRIPYNKKQYDFVGDFFASNQYAVVIQDTRGKWESEGEYTPFVNELDDGLTSLDWLSEQKWCNGKIGMWGSSYVAHCSLILAAKNHDVLKSVFSISGWLGGQKTITCGGATHLMLGLPWILHEETQRVRSLKGYDLDELFEYLPVKDVFKSIGINSPIWQEDEGQPADFVEQLSADRINIPVFHMTGWSDFVHNSSIDIYKTASHKSNKSHKLLIGSWAHDQFYTDYTQVGDEDFGPDSAMGKEKLLKLSLRWFDATLKGIQNGMNEDPDVKLFIMGYNKWENFEQWPPKNIEYSKLYLSSNNGANSLSGDGTLLTNRPKNKSFDSFIFNPKKPVPTFGGAVLHFFPNTIGVRDQREIEKRNDILVYTTEELSESIVLIGPIEAVLYISTEGKDTDFTAKLVEVKKDGYARIINEGIIRASRRNSIMENDLLEPGKVYKLKIEIGNTGIHIPKGNKIRLEISSSNFPKYDRNPNTGESAFSATILKSVQQKVYHGGSKSSYLKLPVLRNKN